MLSPCYFDAGRRSSYPSEVRFIPSGGRPLGARPTMGSMEGPKDPTEAKAPFWLARIVVGLVALPIAGLVGLAQASSFTRVDLAVLSVLTIASWGAAFWLARRFRMWPFRRD